MVSVLSRRLAGFARFSLVLSPPLPNIRRDRLRSGVCSTWAALFQTRPTAHRKPCKNPVKAKSFAAHRFSSVHLR